MKSNICIVKSDNNFYFDGKLSKKELADSSIKRIVRNIKIVDDIQSGTITRRNKQPLKVIKQRNKWIIAGVSLKPAHKPIVSKKKVHENFKTLKNISKLSGHEIYLLSVVKFDCQRPDELMHSLKDGSAKDLLDTIPRFSPGQKYKLLNQVFEIIEVNGNLVKYSVDKVIMRKHSEVDLIGEFLRPIKNKMEIIHSEDWLEPMHEEVDDFFKDGK